MTTDKEWNEKLRKDQYLWMNDDQFECFLMLCDLVGGAHHILGKVRPANHNGIQIISQNHGWSTYDFSLLTRTVIMAHDRMIRFEVQSGGPGKLKLHFHKRQNRKGEMSNMHPTIEDAILMCRKK